jgi:hypothetical protein
MQFKALALVVSLILTAVPGVAGQVENCTNMPDLVRAIANAREESLLTGLGR